MKHFATMIAATATAVALTGSAMAQEVTLRVHQMLPAQATIPAKAITPWAERVEEKSEGRIEIELYPGMQLGGAPPQLYDQAKDGVVDIIWTVLGYTPGRFPKSEVFELPFMVGTGEATSRAFQRYVEEYAMDEFEGVKLIAVHTHGPGLFHMNEPVESLADLEGKKVRGGSRIINEMLVSLGAEPIGMPVPAVPEALSKGVIDGTTIPWEVTTALKSSELVSNHTGFEGDRGLYTQTFGFVMNQSAYDNLPDDLKAIIDEESGIEVAAEFGRAMDEGDKQGLAVAQELGNNIITLDPAPWKEAAEPIIGNWVDSTPDGQMLLDAARALIEEEHANAM